MSVVSQALHQKKPFGCSYIFFPLLLVVFGLTSVFVGRQLAPQTNAAAKVFRDDPSCGADLHARTPPGACTTVDAQLLGAEIRKSGNAKSVVRTTFISVRYEDGTIHEAQLDGSAGDIFPYFVKSGAPTRVQLFRGTIVRVTTGTTSAETIDAPDVNAESVSEMPWVGTIAIVVALLIVGLRIYVLTRRT